MPTPFDLLQANYLQGYWNSNPEYTAPYLMEALFTPTKQKADNVKLLNGQDIYPAPLDYTKEDSVALPVERGSLSTGTLPTYKFKNSLNLNETDFKDLNNALGSNDQNLILTITKKMYDDQANLLIRARFTREYYAIQALLNGKLTIGNLVADYGYEKYQSAKATKPWTDAASNPYDDVQSVKDTAAQKSGTALNRALMNSATMYTLMHNEALHNTIFTGSVSPQGNILTQPMVVQWFSAVLGMSVVVYDKGWNNNGKFEKFIPDGKIIFLPGSANAPVGQMNFVETPEENLSGTAGMGSVALFDTGVSLLTKASDDPVTVKTIVDEKFVPTITVAKQVFILDVLAGK
ncbi:major capsid protein [Lentilactobacillus kefiri]|uniref:major capsid protein n=1 Tax=Lentilactobacillus kefiri TaxID=33962 RepID=UPI0021C2A0C1|nr:major capsid protein [Lentilactobacillus kefiri]